MAPTLEQHRLVEEGRPGWRSFPWVGPWVKVQSLVAARRHYGWVVTYRSKHGKHPLKIYWARREPHEEFRADKSWAIDLATVSFLRMSAIKFIGVYVSNGMRLLVSADIFRTGVPPASGLSIRAYDKKGGARQFYLEESQWRMSWASPELVAAETLKAMRIKGSRTPKSSVTAT